jgi:uncharacterized membrane protein (UPF0127 family)
MQKENVVAVTWILVVAATVAAAAAPGGSGQAPNEGVFSTSDGNVTVELEVADSSREREKGLMRRESLAEDRGMLFIFPSESERIFWMKDTLIPLDIIFIDADREVVDIDQAEPQPGVPHEELKLYRSDSPAKYVVEVNQGFAERNGVERGSKFYFTQR